MLVLVSTKNIQRSRKRKILEADSGQRKEKSSMQTRDDPFGIWMNKIKDLEGITR